MRPDKRPDLRSSATDPENVAAGLPASKMNVLPFFMVGAPLNFPEGNFFMGAEWFEFKGWGSGKVSLGGNSMR